MPAGAGILPRITRVALRKQAGFLLAALTMLVPGLAAGQAGGAAAPLPRPWTVLTLNVSDTTLPAFVALDAAFREGLGRPQGRSVDVFIENFDLLRFRSSQLEGELVALIEKKYAAFTVDIVVPITPIALDFAERYRDRLWPGARIVFQEVPEGSLRTRKLSPTTTGVVVQYPFLRTVALAQSLQRDLRRLVVVGGSGDFDRGLAGLARAQLAQLPPDLAVEYWLELPLDELLARLSRLGNTDAVMYLSMGRDAVGRTFVPREVLRQIGAASAVPIYSVFETYVGYGLAAGQVHSFPASGRRASALVNEVLGRPAGETVPLVPADLSICAADAAQLARFGLAAPRLPAGCEIRNGRPSLWSEYKWWILGALLLLLAQFTLIFGLLFERNARRKAEAETQRRRTELTHASRLALAGELTASIAHEINQPLGAILANAGAAEALLGRDQIDVDELRAILSDIRRSDVRASEIIKRVRALVSGSPLQRDDTDVNALVRDVLALLQREARRRQVSLETHLGADLPSLPADRVQLQQALTNLCINAMDAMEELPPEWRKLRISTARTPDGIEITVSDSGPGIAPDKLPQLFDSFFTTKAHGMGLGLSITRSIVEAHGGNVWARNLPEGGALFRIALPVGSRPAALRTSP